VGFLRAIAVSVCLVGVAVLGCAGVAAGGAPAPGGDALRSAWTPRQGELVETIPIARRRLAEPRSVLSLELPKLKRGDRIRFNGEVTATTTCVEGLERCIGRPYRFDPRLGARIVLAGRRGAAGRATEPVSARASLACEQTRPNRNHHCPLVIEGRLTVGRPGALPCNPDSCRLNLLLDAHHRKARGGEVIVVGADRPDGSIEGGKARLSAALSRAGAELQVRERVTRRLRAGSLPAGGTPRVVLSQRLPGLDAGDVLLASARQRTAIRELPYFVAAKIVLSTRPRSRRASRYAKRVTSRAGTLTETNGFNCTIGLSAFRSPCATHKAGLAQIKRTPRRPLYANLVARSFPKRAQARAAFPPARVKRARMRITRLRLGD
jgi:hypothetical protein